MNEYMLELVGPEDAEITSADLGRRAARLRDALGMTPEQAADKAGIQTSVYLSFESNGEASVSEMLAIHHALSRGGLEELFSTPRFHDIADYQSYLERRKRA